MSADQIKDLFLFFSRDNKRISRKLSLLLTIKIYNFFIHDEIKIIPKKIKIKKTSNNRLMVLKLNPYTYAF